MKTQISALMTKQLKNRGILAILFFALVIRIALLLKNPQLWWDSAVYIGMGKYLFSFGKIGLWEYFRPLMWPILLGSLWKAGLNPILVGRILDLCFSLGIVFLTYAIGKKVFDKRIGIYAAMLVAVYPIFFKFTALLYNGISATFFAMCAVYFFVYADERRSHYLLSGIFAGLCFLTRFTQGTVFLTLVIGAGISSFFRKKLQFSYVLELSSGFLITVFPFFVSNYYIYGSFILPLVGARQVIEQIVATAPAVNTTWYFYLVNPHMILLIILAFIGLYFVIKEGYNTKDRNMVILALLFLLPFIYYNTLTFKELRYVVDYLPFLALMTFAGIFKVKHRFLKRAAMIVIIIFICFLVSEDIIITQYTQTEPEPIAQYNRFFSGKNVIVASTSPDPVLYSDILLIPLYSVDSSMLNIEMDQLDSMYSSFYIMFSKSNIPCPDSVCENLTERAFNMLRNRYKTVYSMNYSSNEYNIFEKQSTNDWENPIVILRIDDVGEPKNFEAYKKLNDVLISKALPADWLTMPMFMKYNLTASQRNYLIDIYKKGNFSIIQHGYWHETAMVVNNTEFKGLAYEEQLDRISSGKQLLTKYFNQTITAFAPPYNSADQNTIRALDANNFTIYLTAVWDDVDVGDMHRYNTDIPLITDWTPPYPMRSIKELKADFEKYKYKKIIIVEIHPHKLKTDKDFEILVEFIDYLQENNVAFMNLDGADKLR